MSKIVHNFALLHVLCEAMGLNEALIQRIVIDVDIREVVHVYTQHVGSAELLNVDWPVHLKDATITTVPKPPQEGNEE